MAVRPSNLVLPETPFRVTITVNPVTGQSEIKCSRPVPTLQLASLLADHFKVLFDTHVKQQMGIIDTGNGSKAIGDGTTTETEEPPVKVV